MPQIAHRLGARDDDDESEESVEDEWNKIVNDAVKKTIRFLRVLPYELLIVEPQKVGKVAVDFMKIPVLPDKLRRRVVNAKRAPIHPMMVRQTVINYLKEHPTR